MSQTCLTSPARKQRIDHSDDTWTEIAEQFENGVPTPLLAARYNLDASTINKRMAREGRVRRGPGPLLAEGMDPVASLEEARNATIAGLLNAFNDNRPADLLLFAKVAAILDRLGAKPGKSSPDPVDRAPAFTPKPDIFELLAEHGLTKEDVR